MYSIISLNDHLHKTTTPLFRPVLLRTDCSPCVNTACLLYNATISLFRITTSNTDHKLRPLPPITTNTKKSIIKARPRPC